MKMLVLESCAITITTVIPISDEVSIIPILGECESRFAAGVAAQGTRLREDGASRWGWARQFMLTLIEVDASDTAVSSSVTHKTYKSANTSEGTHA